MQKIEVRTGVPYAALIEDRLLRSAGILSRSVLRGGRIMIVSDERVAPLYLAETKQAFETAGFRVFTFTFPEGEGAKRLSTVEQLLNAADSAGLTRSDAFVSLGGGVVCDLTGLAAALYLRGVDYIQIPTTLLAMADASVGGKTAVNLVGGKNLCGAFHQPQLVLCDPRVLETLSPAVYAEGMAEVIKHGALGGGSVLDLMQSGAPMADLIAENIRIKSDIVSRDEHEQNLRQLLNLGHTFGHAVEKLSGFSVYHGEGVSVGMLIAAWASVQAGRCGEEVFRELKDLLQENHLPVATVYSAREIASAAMNDKKRRGDRITVVLPVGRGACELVPVPAAELEALITPCDGVVTGLDGGLKG